MNKGDSKWQFPRKFDFIVRQLYRIGDKVRHGEMAGREWPSCDGPDDFDRISMGCSLRARLAGAAHLRGEKWGSRHSKRNAKIGLDTQENGGK